ncbi:hypothetical protein, partial [Salmonella sp. SAL4438]|uniref:hypothetical protein n=1 Tax=Salmonella sp. SAL4438 TaxID=3159893 RepID=UPI00397B6051
RYLEWYAAGDRERLWEAASDRYRDEICGGRPEDCPHLDGVPLGNPIDRRLDCDRRRCTFVRRDAYATPPLPWSKATEIEWIVTTDP